MGPVNSRATRDSARTAALPTPPPPVNFPLAESGSPHTRAQLLWVFPQNLLLMHLKSTDVNNLAAGPGEAASTITERCWKYKLRESEVSTVDEVGPPLKLHSPQHNLGGGVSGCVCVEWRMSWLSQLCFAI